MAKYEKLDGTPWDSVFRGAYVGGHWIDLEGLEQAGFLRKAEITRNDVLDASKLHGSIVPMLGTCVDFIMESQTRAQEFLDFCRERSA